MTDKILCLIFAVAFACIAIILASTAITDLMHIDLIESALEALFALFFANASINMFKYLDKTKDE